jgi:hypothetical protein
MRRTVGLRRTRSCERSCPVLRRVSRVRRSGRFDLCAGQIRAAPAKLVRLSLGAAEDLSRDLVDGFRSCDSRCRNSSRPQWCTIACVMTAPRDDMRVASHGGTRPPWRGVDRRFRFASPFAAATPITGGRPQSFRRASGFRSHRPEGYRVALRFDGRDAVLPDLPRRPRHHVDRTWPDLQCEPFPLRIGGPSKPEFAGRA